MASEKDSGSGGKDANENPDAVTARTTNQAVLQYFWDMASYDENVRVTAARGLVKDLTEEQSKHLATLKKDTEAPPAEGTSKFKLLEYHLRRCSPTLVYTLRRLARGLGSSRQAARQGYATALTGLLAASRCISPAGLLVLLEVCIDGPLKGGDAKDTLLGRLFGCAALLRSGMPLESPVQATVFNSLLQCGQGKSFLRECAAAVALEAAQHMDAEAIAAVTARGQPLVTMLAVDPAEATPEALLLALVLWPKLPASVLQTCRLLPANTPPPPSELFFGAAAVGGGALSPAATAAAAVTAAGLFSREHLQLLMPALLASSGSHPRMHMLWQYLLPLLLPGFRPHRNLDLLDVPAEAATSEPPPSGDATVANGSVNKKSAKKAAKAARAAEGKGAVHGPLLEAFWSVVVEGGLMDSSHERRYLGFQLFSRVLPHLRPEHVSSVFSPAFTRTLVASVKRPDSYLHASARKLLDGLSSFLERSNVADSTVKMAVAAALQRLGGFPMKQLTSSKITQKLVQGLDAEGVHRYVTSLMGAFLAGAPSTQSVEGLPSWSGHANGRDGAHGEKADEAQDEQVIIEERRGLCVEQLVAALKFPDAAQSDCEAALRFLALHAFAEVNKPEGKASKSNKVAEVHQAVKQLTSQLSPAIRTRCASRLVTLIAHLSHAAQSRSRAAQQQQPQHLDANAAKNADDAGSRPVEEAAGQPAAKKRKTSTGGAETTAAAATSGPPLATSHQYLHDTLSFIRKALKAPGVSLAVKLGDDGDNALQLLAAIETASLERLSHPDEAPQVHGKHAGHGVNASAAVRSLAALAAHLQLQLLADPEGFEMDLPLSLRRVAAEGLGVEGLPEVEEQSDKRDEDGEEAAKGKSGGSWNDVLVDVVLAVMARPVGLVPIAPLRDTAESLWRQCCAVVSVDGLADIVRVVSAGGKGEGQSTAGLFESDEEEEEEEDDEEEEEEGSESEDEGKEDGEAARGKKGQTQVPVQTTSRKRKKVGKGSDVDSESDTEADEGEDNDDEEEDNSAHGGSGKKVSGKGSRGNDEDKSEDDDEGLDDEAMFRMDDKLAAYFRSLVGGRAGSTEAAERASALLNFRLRALALLEAFAKKVPNSPLLLTCLEPLLRALATASRPGGQPEMAKRLRGVIANKISKCKCRLDLACLGGLEGYTSTLKRLLYEASRNRDKPVAATAWQAYMAVLRAGASADAEEPEAATAAQSSFRAALSDLLIKKKTRLQIEELVAAFRTVPTACLPSLDLLLQHVSAGRNATVRVAAAELLAQLLKTQPDGLKAAVAAGGPGGIGGALGSAVAACVSGVGLKVKQHVRAAQAAIKVAKSLKRLMQGKRPAELMGADKINAIAKAVVTVQSLGTAAKVDTLHRRLTDAMALGPLLEKTKPDPALAARIQKARPDSVGAAAAGTAKGKEKGKTKKKGSGEDKELGKNSAERKQGDTTAGKDKKERQEGKAKRRKGKDKNEQDDVEISNEEGVSQGNEKADSDSDSEASSEPEEGPSSSGRVDSDGLDEDSEDSKQPGGGKRGRAAGDAASRKARKGQLGGQHGGKGVGKGGQTGRGGRSQPGNDRKHEQEHGGSAAKKARR